MRKTGILKIILLSTCTHININNRPIAFIVGFYGGLKAHDWLALFTLIFFFSCSSFFFLMYINYISGDLRFSQYFDKNLNSWLWLNISLSPILYRIYKQFLVRIVSRHVIKYQCRNRMFSIHKIMSSSWIFFRTISLLCDTNNTHYIKKEIKCAKVFILWYWNENGSLKYLVK